MQAQLVVGPTLEESCVTVSVALASIDTANEMRDIHLRSAELFDVENRTSMSYRSTRVRGEGSDWILDGELTIGTITQPLALPVEFGVSALLRRQPTRRLRGDGEIRRKDFELDR